MDLTGLLTALKESPFATALREGEYYFPWTESVHVLSITIVVGVISIVDLRLMGVIAHKKDVSGLLRQDAVCGDQSGNQVECFVDVELGTLHRGHEHRQQRGWGIGLGE